MAVAGNQSLGGFSSDLGADQKVEKLVSDIAAVIRSAGPEKRGELKELAETLLHDEISSIAERGPIAPTPAVAQRFNPLLPGILVTLAGLGFFLLFPPVGLALAGIGAGLMIWGAVLSWLRT
jgi:hypothetical protein